MTCTCGKRRTNITLKPVCNTRFICLGAAPMERIALVVTTVADNDAGRALIEALLDKRLIACGHVAQSGHSIFRWKGEICDQPEFTVVLKTCTKLRAKAMEEVMALHPYDLPEILSCEAVASPEYAMWVENEVC